MTHSSGMFGQLHGVECGALWYSAPEVYLEKRVLKSDVWALGISLVEMAEGMNPYVNRAEKEVMEMVCWNDPPSLSGEEWSPEFVDFVSKCLVKDVEERWDASELMNVHGFCNE